MYNILFVFLHAQSFREILKLIILIFIPFATIAQNKTLDSLKKTYYDKFDSLSANYYLEKALNDIDREEDEFTNEVTFRTNLLKPVSITKVIRNNKATYYLSLSTRGNTINYNKKGVYILFTDGKKWVKLDEEIDVDYNDGYEYSAFIKLNPIDIKLFQTKKIDKFKLYIYEGSVNPTDSDNFILQMNFIQNLK